MTPTDSGVSLVGDPVGKSLVELVLIESGPLGSHSDVDRGLGGYDVEVGLVVIIVYTLLVATFLSRRRHVLQAKGELATPDPAIPTSSVQTAGPSNQSGAPTAENLAVRCARLAQSHGLTPREADVFALLVRGRSVPVIADALSIAQSTAKGHARNIYEKFGVKGKQELIDLFESEG